MRSELPPLGQELSRWSNHVEAVALWLPLVFRAESADGARLVFQQKQQASAPSSGGGHVILRFDTFN